MVALRKFVGLADEFEIVVGPVLAHVAHELTELGYGEHIGRDLFAQGGHFFKGEVSSFLVSDYNERSRARRRRGPRDHEAG
jgi:hypothetical protein